MAAGAGRRRTEPGVAIAHASPSHAKRQAAPERPQFACRLAGVAKRPLHASDSSGAHDLSRGIRRYLGTSGASGGRGRGAGSAREALAASRGARAGARSCKDARAIGTAILRRHRSAAERSWDQSDTTELGEMLIKCERSANVELSHDRPARAVGEAPLKRRIVPKGRPGELKLLRRDVVDGEEAQIEKAPAQVDGPRSFSSCSKERKNFIDHVICRDERIGIRSKPLENARMMCVGRYDTSVPTARIDEGHLASSPPYSSLSWSASEKPSLGLSTGSDDISTNAATSSAGSGGGNGVSNTNSTGDPSWSWTGSEGRKTPFSKTARIRFVMPTSAPIVTHANGDALLRRSGRERGSIRAEAFAASRGSRAGSCARLLAAERQRSILRRQ